MIPAAKGAAPYTTPVQAAISARSVRPSRSRWLGKKGRKLIIPQAVTRLAAHTTQYVRFHAGIEPDTLESLRGQFAREDRSGGAREHFFAVVQELVGVFGEPRADLVGGLLAGGEDLDHERIEVRSRALADQG